MWNFDTVIDTTFILSPVNNEIAATSDAINTSITKGIGWLLSQQNIDDGSWGGSYKVAQTALAVLKLETYAIEQNLSPLSPDYIYSSQVQNGLNYIFSQAIYTDIGIQTHDGNPDDPDVIGDGKGIYFQVPSEPNYYTGIALMAIAASTEPNMTVTLPGDLAPKTYKEIAQHVVDYLSWAQTDSDNGRGGWDYYPQDNSGPRSDNSVSGWVITGLIFAESPFYKFNCTIPQFVKNELNIWINYIQNKVVLSPEEGGSGYDSPTYWVNILKTGSLLQQMAFLGDTSSTQRVQNAVDYIVRHWNDNNSDPGWRGNTANYQATFTIMKGFTSLGLDTIGNPGFDWFDEISTVLVLEQNVDGSWPQTQWDEGNLILSTAWALLTLEKASPPLPPVTPTRGIDFLKLKI